MALSLGCYRGSVSVAEIAKANFGIDGLDDITVGGLARGRLFLIEGSPGTGKTTVATQFLAAGAAAREPSLYITLSETEDEFRAGAQSHGWSLDGIDIFELVPPESLLDEDQQHCCRVVGPRTQLPRRRDARRTGVPRPQRLVHRLQTVAAGADPGSVHAARFRTLRPGV